MKDAITDAALTKQEKEPFTPAQDSATVIEPADTIVDKSDAQIDSELADIFALIDKITDADKLRRIQAHLKARLAKIDLD